MTIYGAIEDNRIIRNSTMDTSGFHEDEPLIDGLNEEESALHSRSGARIRHFTSQPQRTNQQGVVVYASFMLMGLGTLLPWNFFITADSYWMYKFRNVSAGDDWNLRSETYLQAIYTPVQVSVSQLTNFSFLFINSLYFYKFPQTCRMITSLMIVFFFFSVTTILVEVNSDGWQRLFFIVTIVIIIIMNAAGAVFQGSLFGIAGRFPLKYINAVGMGLALGGVFASLARIASVYFSPDPLTSALIYFLIATIIMFFALLEYLRVSRTAFFKYYSNSESSQELLSRSTSESSFKDHVRILKMIWPYAVSIAFIYVVTISVYPVIMVRIVSSINNATWADLYFHPVATFLMFNMGDFISRLIAEKILWPRKGSILLHILVLLRVIFIPLFLLCNHEDLSLIPVVFTHDAWYISFMAFFSFSGGYCFALAMMYAPKMVPSEDAEKASSIMASMIGLGLLLGASLSFGFSMLL